MNTSKKRKSIFGKIILDSTMIILSVLVALFINEWRNSHNEEIKTKLILENVKEEIQSNKKTLQKLIIYHKSIQEKIILFSEYDSIEQKFFSDGRFTIFEAAPKGIIQNNFNDIAWIVAKEDKITNRISFEESQILFAVYEQQKFVFGTIERIINFLVSREVQNKELLKESIIILETEMQELIGQEEVLNDRYAKALNIIVKEKNK